MLTERALAARKAAEAKDKKGTFDEGAKVYEVCVACHEQFVIQPEIKANGPAKGDPLPTFPKAVEEKIEKKAGG
jgi:cytochrome c2